MKRLICIAAALVLVATFTLSVAAYPEETVPYDYQHEHEYPPHDHYQPDYQHENEHPYNNEAQPEEDAYWPDDSFAAPPEPVTVDIDEIIAGVVDEIQASPIPPCPFDEASLIVTYAAAGASLLALVLVIVALAKIGKIKRENATGNYKKFF